MTDDDVSSLLMHVHLPCCKCLSEVMHMIDDTIHIGLTSISWNHVSCSTYGFEDTHIGKCLCM